MSYENLNDKRTDEEVFRQLEKEARSVDLMAEQIRDCLEQKKGGKLSQVKTDAPLSLSGQWGGARVTCLVIAAALVAAVAVVCACVPDPPDTPIECLESGRVRRAQGVFLCAKTLGCTLNARELGDAIGVRAERPDCFPNGVEL